MIVTGMQQPFYLHFLFTSFANLNSNTTTTMKQLLFLFITSIISVAAAAQLKGFSLGPYIEAAWPTGNFKKTTGTGLGIGLTADVNLPGKWSATGSAGYLHFRKLNDATHPVDSGETINALPLRAGVKYKLPLIYFKVEGGSAKMLNGESAPIIFSPGVGLRMLGVDIQGAYETWFRDKSTNFWSLRLAYHF